MGNTCRGTRITRIILIIADKTGMELIHKEITDRIIKSFYEVYNYLGYGFLEKVYENSLNIEFTESGLQYENQKRLSVKYKGNDVGLYVADFVIENSVIVEVKACESIIEEHEFQLINYLKSTNIEVGLLLNFGKKPDFKRKVFSNKK